MAGHLSACKTACADALACLAARARAAAAASPHQHHHLLNADRGCVALDIYNIWMVYTNQRCDIFLCSSQRLVFSACDRVQDARAYTTHMHECSRARARVSRVRTRMRTRTIQIAEVCRNWKRAAELCSSSVNNNNIHTQKHTPHVFDEPVREFKYGVISSCRSGFCCCFCFDRARSPAHGCIVVGRTSLLAGVSEIETYLRRPSES